MSPSSPDQIGEVAYTNDHGFFIKAAPAERVDESEAPLSVWAFYSGHNAIFYPYACVASVAIMKGQKSTQ